MTLNQQYADFKNVLMRLVLLLHPIRLE